VKFVWEIWVDIEQCVAINFPVGAVIQFPATDNAAAMLVHDADHHTNVLLFNLDALLEECADGIGEILRRSAKGKRRQQYRETNDADGSDHFLHLNKSSGSDKNCSDPVFEESMPTWFHNLTPKPDVLRQPDTFVSVPANRRPRS
jgi:hypothetical protein